MRRRVVKKIPPPHSDQAEKGESAAHTRRTHLGVAAAPSSPAKGQPASRGGWSPVTSVSVGRRFDPSPAHPRTRGLAVARTEGAFSRGGLSRVLSRRPRMERRGPGIRQVPPPTGGLIAER